MKRIFFILLVALILLGLLFYTIQSKENTLNHRDKNNRVTKNTIQDSSQNSIYSQSIKKEKKLYKQKNIQVAKENKDQKEIKKVVMKVVMYETLSSAEASLRTKPRHAIAHVSAIAMQKHILQAKDTLVFPNIEGLDYTIKISHVMTHNDGSTSTTGAYIDEGITYTTTITQSDTQSFISLATAQGLYEIEASNGVGYIYRTDAIRQYLQSKPLNDTIILPLLK